MLLLYACQIGSKCWKVIFICRVTKLIYISKLQYIYCNARGRHQLSLQQFNCQRFNQSVPKRTAYLYTISLLPKAPYKRYPRITSSLRVKSPQCNRLFILQLVRALHLYITVIHISSRTLAPAIITSVSLQYIYPNYNIFCPKFQNIYPNAASSIRFYM